VPRQICIAFYHTQLSEELFAITRDYKFFPFPNEIWSNPKNKNQTK
jgi:hypothetical protein